MHVLRLEAGLPIRARLVETQTLSASMVLWQACRSAERTAPVCDAIRAETGNDAVEYWHLGAATPLILRNCLHDDSPPSRELLSLCLV